MVKSFVLMVLLSALVSARAQDPCQDATGLTRMEDEFDNLFAQKTDPDARMKAIASGKAFLEKYGNCPLAKERADWLRLWLQRISNHDPFGPDHSSVAAFSDALKSKDWGALYANGDRLLQTWPDDYRPVEIVLGSVGYGELLQGDARWADKTLKYAKLSLRDLDGGKPFRLRLQPNDYYGVAPFAYRSREDATAWMNLIAGTIYVLAEKDWRAAVPYLYRATFAPEKSEVAKNPKPFEFIGDFYLAELKQNSQGTRADQYADQAMVAFARAFRLTAKVEDQAMLRQKFITAYRLRWKKVEPEEVDKIIEKTSAGTLLDPEILLDEKGVHQ